MNKNKKETLTRSDIEKSLKKQFPNLTKTQISDSLDIITRTIVNEVALDKNVQIRGLGTFSKKYIRPRKFINPKTKKYLI